MTIATPPAKFDAETVDDEHFATILDAAEYLASYATSIREGAFRRDRMVIALHISELRLCGIELVKAYRALSDRGTP
jgi:hypothetical protein